ncbi:MAG: hypothetical protein KC478_15610 [Bacteriovoracaceae bacterium]|nr:hypothetical protein [Bacteriovoracaceae bacterium]
MKKATLLFLMITTSLFATELKLVEGDQYFGRTNDQIGAVEEYCAISFNKIEHQRTSILGYKENFLHVSIELVSSDITKDFILRNKAQRVGTKFTPMEFEYFGKENLNQLDKNSSLVLNLNRITKLPESFTYIFYMEGKLTQKTCNL